MKIKMVARRLKGNSYCTVALLREGARQEGIQSPAKVGSLMKGETVERTSVKTSLSRKL